MCNLIYLKSLVITNVESKILIHKKNFETYIQSEIQEWS